MDKELFNQPLKDNLGLTDRIALGIPGQESCDNMLVSRFIEIVLTYVNNLNQSSGLYIADSRVGTKAVTAGNNTVQFVDINGDASPFLLDVDDNYILIPDFRGLGGTIITQDRTGFVCNVLESGTIAYHAIAIKSYNQTTQFAIKEKDVEITEANLKNGDIVTILDAPGATVAYFPVKFVLHYKYDTDVYDCPGSYFALIKNTASPTAFTLGVDDDFTEAAEDMIYILDASMTTYLPASSFLDKAIIFELSAHTGTSAKGTVRVRIQYLEIIFN